VLLELKDIVQVQAGKTSGAIGDKLYFWDAHNEYKTYDGDFR
jgi:hypothetical protein